MVDDDLDATPRTEQFLPAALRGDPPGIRID
jgi:hypothetical protein